MTCKNCGNEIADNRIYCSLTCRNIYVNKNLRDYTKVKETADKKRKIKEDLYYVSPKYCKHCDKIISFENRRLNYCNNSCSASHTNKNKKGLKHILSEEGLKNILDTNRKRFNIDAYYEEPKKCLNCEEILEFKFRSHIFCNVNCKKEYYSKNLEDFKLYKSLTKFKFHLKDYNDEFDFTLIENNGWYKAKNNGDNVDGASRDHMISVKDGFRKLINPLLISHPANCEIISNKKNQSKHDKCSLTIEELLNRIEIFEIKYGKYYEKYIKPYIDLNELREIYNENKYK